MIDLDSYEAQAEEGELHVRQIIDVIRELRECRAERDAAIARAERAEAERDDANGRRDLVCAAMLMVGCELAGDPKIDPRNRRDARHTPTLLLAAEVRARAEAADDRREPMTWGRPVTDADGDRYRDLFAGLTPDEVRVITGLVRAMRESRGGLLGPNENFGGIGAAKDCLRVGALGSAAWHIAHAISQMASGDEDASRVLGERGW